MGYGDRSHTNQLRQYFKYKVFSRLCQEMFDGGARGSRTPCARLTKLALNRPGLAPSTKLIVTKYSLNFPQENINYFKVYFCLD